MTEFRKVRIVGENLDFPGCIVEILKGISTAIFVFLLICLAGVILGNEAVSRMSSGVPNEILFHKDILMLSFMGLFFSVGSIYVIVTACNEED